jgi:hypothetical protein
MDLEFVSADEAERMFPLLDKNTSSAGSTIRSRATSTLGA